MIGVTRFERRRASGWRNVMHVVELGGGELLIYSPTHIDDATYEQIERLGRVRWLVAPNHFHHLGLARYRARFPDALAVASSQALRRLASKGHLGLRSAEEVELPPAARFLVLPHTKNGETWLSLASDSGRMWLVCDGFFHEPRPVTGVEGFVLRALKIAPGLCIGATFTQLCVADRGRYRDAVLDLLAKERPSGVYFSHGEPLSDDVTARLTTLLVQRFG